MCDFTNKELVKDYVEGKKTYGHAAAQSWEDSC